MNTIVRVIAAAGLSLGAVGTPADAAGLNVTCQIAVAGANVVPNRHTAVGVTYGTDAAAATITCVSLTGDEYIAWVDVEVRGYAGQLIGAKDWGHPATAVGGVAVAATSPVVGPYDEGSAAPLNRTHTAIALGYVAPLCWPSCPNEPKGIVSLTYVA